MPSRAEEAYNPDRPSAGQTTAHVSTPKAKPQPPTAVNEADLIQQQREEVKQFIRLLTSNNIGYHALAKENIDIELLRGMYQSMNLPSEPEPIPPPKTNGAAASKPSVQSLDNTAVTSAQSLPERSAPAVSTNVAAASAAGAAASPVDRKDYLARLQAAKLARQSAPAKASPPLKSPPAAVASPATGISTPQATATPTRKQPITDEQKARQTELIKQRLEALKAQSKQSVPVSNTAAQKPGPMPTTTQQPRTPGVNTPAQQSSVSSFPSIPGLFMNTPMKSGNGTTTPSRQPQIVPQKRPAQSDTETSTPRGSVTPYNRPFGQSPRAQQEESMIIEVSDDESNGSEMDIDDDQASLGPATIRQTPMSIPGFPPRQAPVPAAPSAVSTPGPQTPATLARTGELSTKEQELAALKQTLKRKLAEQKRIKEAAEAASAASSAAAASAAVPRTTPSKQPDTAQAPLQPAVRARETSASATTQSGSSTIDSSRDRKRRRRTEIQEQLPSLDDEIANNEAEMARLASDLERLKANNERIVKDKQRLIKELEDLGIDTEGMSHAELRATKNEIERATSPDVETRSQAVDVPSQSLPNGTSTGIAAASAESTTNVTEAESGSAHAPPAVISQPNAQYSFLPGLGQATPQVVASTASRPPPQRSQERSAATSHDVQAEAAKSEVVKDTDGPAIRDNSRASATPMDDDEDFYSPPPPADVQVHTIPDAVGISEPQVAQAVTDAPSPSEEGEIEMSESSEEEDEEEYEPDEPAVEEPYGEPQSQQAQMPDPQTEPSQGEPLLSVRQSQVSTEDEDAYEPPDVDEEMAEAGSGADAIQPETSSPGDADDGAMDIATSSSEDENDSDSDSDEGTQSESGDDVSQPIVTERNTNIADDLAPELQPGLSATLVPVAAPSDNVPVVEEEPEPAGFTPYESPLRMFKSYRYHPNYSQEVDGGFLSLTFSHQIDPEKPLCPFESAGGSCNDPECPNQHFRGMGITGACYGGLSTHVRLTPPLYAD
jgi:hypothetical protein